MDRLPSLRRRRAAALGALALGVVLALAAPGGAAIYKWVDEKGTTHYTDRIEGVPPEFRPDAMSQDDLATIPFNQLDGLNVLPGEADGTDAGTLPMSTDPAEMQAQLDAFIEEAGASLMAGFALAVLVMAGLVFALMAWMLLIACRVVGEDGPGFKKAYGIVIVQTLAGMLAAPGMILVAGTPDPTDMGAAIRFQAATVALSVIINALVLRGMLTDSASRALVLAVVTILVSIGIGLVLGVGIALLAVVLA